MRSDAAQQQDSVMLERRWRRAAALAELSQVSITAADVDALLPHAHGLIRSTLGVDIDLDALLQDPPERVTVNAQLDADEIEFVDAVVNVCKMLGGQRARENDALSEVEGRFARIF